MDKKAVFLCFLAGFLFFSSCAKKGSNSQPEGGILAVSEHKPVADGRLSDGEYSLSLDLAKMKVFLSRNNEQLFFGVQADEKGWISIGFGTLVMNQAKILIGYVRGEKSEVKEQIGRGNRHSDVDPALLLTSALSENAESTFFEGVLDASRLIAPGQEDLGLIVGCSGEDDFEAYHSFRDSVSVRLK